MVVINREGLPHTNLCVGINQYVNTPLNPDILNLLVLYDENSTFTSTVQEYLLSFSKYSKHNVFFAGGTKQTECFYDFKLFDAVLLHYSVRISLPGFISPSVVKALREFSGLKVLFIQDEYETTETARCWMETLGINLVFSVVPQASIQKVYSPERFPNTEFVSTLTGFVPEALEKRFPIVPISQRPLHIGYRGRELPYWYGRLGREKYEIGVKMKQFCQQKGLPHDIEWESEKRIYGDNWYHFLSSCRATLGTESGANVFDDFGDIRKSITEALCKSPNLGFEVAYKQYVEPHEGFVRMNQISPKIFEAIILRTALILFEGEYSGVIQPDRHYIPLKKDFSNVDDVLAKLEDLNYLETLTENAYRDIVKSGSYSYQSFVERVDSLIEERVPYPQRLGVIKGIVGIQGSSVTDSLFPALATYMHAIPLETILDKPVQPLNTSAFFCGPNQEKYRASHTCLSCGIIQLKRVNKEKKNFVKQIGREINRFFNKKILQKDPLSSKSLPDELRNLCVECLKNKH